MSEESTTPGLVELTSRQLEAANRGDLDAFMSVFAPDAVYDASRDGLGVFEGRDAIRGLIGDWWAAFEDFRLTPEEFRDFGNGVALAVLRHDGRPVGSTSQVNTRQAYVFVLLGGLIARMTVYSNIDEAGAAAERLADLGLKEQATSHDNVEIVRRANRLSLGGDVDAIEHYLDPEIEWETRWPGLPPVFHGREGVKEWAARVVEPMQVDMQLVYARALDQQRVLAIFRLHGQGRGSGVPTEMDVFDVYSLRGGMIFRRQTFYTEGEALEAVAPEE